MDCQDKIYSNNIERKCGEIILVKNSKFWFVCTFCEERFQSIVIFGNHVKAVHIGTDIDNFPYIKDENPLDLPSNENDHIIKWDSDERNGCCNVQTGDVETFNNLISNPSEYKFVADEEIGDCNDIDENESDYKEIVEISSKTKIKKNNVQELENEEVVKSNIKCENVINRGKESLVCKDIGDVFLTVKKKNRKKKVYSCDLCEHIGCNKVSLEAHMRSLHGTGTRHQCEECGKCFRNGSNLRIHMIIHSGERPYKCDFCDSGFSHPTHLKTHRYIHTGERPYKCDQCDKGFISSSWLKIHMREHTGETPYVCSFCEKGFARKCSYNKHIISHSGRRAHGCQQCEKSFLHKETLTKHMACHSSEKQFACDVCPKKFNHKKNLVQHQKLHLNIKQYICKICNKDFAQYAGLYSHIKYHKKNKD